MSLFRRQSTADPAESEFICDSEAYPEEPQKKEIPWRAINAAVILLHIVFPIGLFAGIYTIGSSGILFWIALFANLILGAVSKSAGQQGTRRKLLPIMRVIAIGSIVLFYVPFVIMTGFQHSKWLYPVKRHIYGGYARSLPEQLPEICEAYFYLTEGQMIAQDYHASSYLAFYTDTATLDRYAASFGGERIDTPRVEEMTEEEQAARSYSDYPNCPGALPEFVIGRVKPTEELNGAVIFRRHESNSMAYYGPGLLLDYDSGYVIFWT